MCSIARATVTVSGTATKSGDMRRPAVRSGYSSNSRIASVSCACAVSSISASERLEEARHDRLPQPLARRLADASLPVAQADHGLRHRAVAARAADLAERTAHHIARGANVPHVAHADVELAVHGAGHDRPLRALDLKEELRELGDQLGVGDGPEVREDDP